MKKFFYNMLSGTDGSVSTKRVIGFVGFCFLTAAMCINLFFVANATPSAELIDAVTYITIAALFGNTAEKFAAGKTSDSITESAK